MVVQILFHEQAQATVAIKLAAQATVVIKLAAQATVAIKLAAHTNRAPPEPDWEIKVPLRSKSLRTPSRMNLNDEEAEKGAASQPVNPLKLVMYEISYSGPFSTFYKPWTRC
ncbi:hypothetical protein OSB04_022114 [Centaurea solstitialis]|uniref:Uncharacterized protein n=1 Tax=Centaurea solstitialis TaxID=347529 RepID=A0AA38T8X8_9ASTR|nr:hypothetical protein OSB04_022114 [Centaurea solstitialis]